MTNSNARCRHLLAEMYRDEAGASMVEYVFVILLVTILSIAAMGILGGNIHNKMNNVGANIGTRAGFGPPPPSATAPRRNFA